MKLNRTLLLFFAFAGMIPPLIFHLISWYNGEPTHNWRALLKTVTISMIVTVTISVSVVSVLIWLQKNHPWQNGIFKRLLLEIFLTTLTSFVLITILTFLLQPITLHEDIKAALFNNIVIAWIMNFVLVAITEGIYFFKQWKQSVVEAESLKKESIRAQFEALKNQVNPHFLFNSLNTLSSLIDQDADLSKEFLDNLSTVYRYVLQHKDEEIVSLKTEFEFITAFTALIKKRRGEQIAFYFNIAQEDLAKGIPPMTLQMLVENAVKHNIASRKRPLEIHIFSEPGMLVVRNNLQRKKKVNSTGIGLQNIQKRYHYLLEQKIEINESEDYFEVKIPIIPNL